MAFQCSECRRLLPTLQGLNHHRKTSMKCQAIRSQRQGNARAEHSNESNTIYLVTAVDTPPPPAPLHTQQSTEELMDVNDEPEGPEPVAGPSSFKQPLIPLRSHQPKGIKRKNTSLEPESIDDPALDTSPPAETEETFDQEVDWIDEEVVEEDYLANIMNDLGISLRDTHDHPDIAGRAGADPDECDVHECPREWAAGQSRNPSPEQINEWRRRFAFAGWRRPSGTDEDVVMEDPPADVFAPFSSELDWRIARWAIKRCPSNAAFDELISEPGVCFIVSPSNS